MKEEAGAFETPASCRLRARASIPSAPQRSAYGATLGASVRLEGILVARARRAELRVYGHRGGALPVWAGRRKLGVARCVTRVAPHRPAARLVAEDPQPGRVLAWSWRVGASPLDDLALLPPRLRVVELPLHIAADEGVEVGRGGDDPPEAQAQPAAKPSLTSSGGGGGEKS